MRLVVLMLCVSCVKKVETKQTETVDNQKQEQQQEQKQENAKTEEVITESKETGKVEIDTTTTTDSITDAGVLRRTTRVRHTTIEPTKIETVTQTGHTEEIKTQAKAVENEVGKVVATGEKNTVSRPSMSCASVGIVWGICGVLLAGSAIVYVLKTKGLL